MRRLFCKPMDKILNEFSGNKARHVFDREGRKMSAHLRRPGTYILVLYLEKNKKIQVGKLAAGEFAAGHYVYVGSAFGSGGLAGRLKHHLEFRSRPHWHIDYLRQVSTLRKIWCSVEPIRCEHEWASRVREMSDAKIPLLKFGATDCKCESHLFYFIAEPDMENAHFPGNLFPFSLSEVFELDADQR